jgi:hypothetical protein
MYVKDNQIRHSFVYRFPRFLDGHCRYNRVAFGFKERLVEHLYRYVILNA